MPKMKTCSAAKKRFKKLKSGLFKRAQAFRRHLLTKKARGRKRDLRGSAYADHAHVGQLRRLMPYS